jgi:MFS family permease
MTLGLGFLLAGMTTAALLLPSSVWILAAVFLLFYIGFAFLQTAITNTVSMTLPEAEAGTGMGLYNLITIISGAFGMAMTAKLLDSGLLHFPVLSSNEIAWSYQNLFLLFALFVLVAGVWYFLVFKKSPHSPGSASH